MPVYRILLACLFLLCASALGVTAQESAFPSPRWWMGGGAGAFLPQGGFADHTANQADWELFLVHRPRAWGPWGVRTTAQFVEHAHTDTSFALPGITVDTRTSSDLIAWTLGPEARTERGALSALAHAGVGVAWARTVTALRTFTNEVGNSNRSDAAVAFEAGAALSWRLLRRDLLLELGGRWTGTGPLEYVPGSGIRRAAGELELTSQRGRMDGIVWRAALGVALDGWVRR